MPTARNSKTTSRRLRFTRPITISAAFMKALRATPAMALNVTDHIWSIGELIDAALAGELPAPAGGQVGRFRVIEGGQN